MIRVIMSARQQQAFSVRPFQPSDYEALAGIRLTVYPEHPLSADELRRTDEPTRGDARLRHERFVAECGGAVVAYGEYAQNPGMYHPRRFLLDVAVLPRWRGRGIGTALFDHVMRMLAPFDPLSVRARAREDAPGVAFLTARGFRETLRTWEATLDPQAFDFRPYDGVEDDLRSQGITITTARDLATRDASWREQLHDVFSDTRVDVPRSEPTTPITFEQFVGFIVDDSGFIPDAYFIAVHDGRVIGTSDLYRSAASDGLFTGFTGVRRAYRGRGVALALKIRALRYARDAGAAWVRTDNASTNQAMLAVNAKLGFEQEPAWLSMVREGTAIDSTT